MDAKKNLNEPHHCSELLERFSEYLEKDMDEVCVKELEEHIDECIECATMMSEFQHLVDLYHKMGHQGPQPCLSEDCRKRVRARTVETGD